jgi:hypothetical protein
MLLLLHTEGRQHAAAARGGPVKAHLPEIEQAGVGGAVPAVLTCLPPTSDGFKNSNDIAGGGRHRRKVAQGDWVQNIVL